MAKDISIESKAKIKLMSKDQIVFQMQMAASKPDYEYSKAIDIECRKEMEERKKVGEWK